MASTTLDADQEDVPDTFVQHVLDGVARALAAVRRHNADPGTYWQEILVAEAGLTGTWQSGSSWNRP